MEGEWRDAAVKGRRVYMFRVEASALDSHAEGEKQLQQEVLFHLSTMALLHPLHTHTLNIYIHRYIAKYKQSLKRRHREGRMEAWLVTSPRLLAPNITAGAMPSLPDFWP